MPKDDSKDEIWFGLFLQKSLNSSYKNVESFNTKPKEKRKKKQAKRLLFVLYRYHSIYSVVNVVLDSLDWK